MGNINSFNDTNMTITPTFYIDEAEIILKQWPLSDILWRGESTRIVRKTIDGNECFAVLSNKNDEVLAHAAYFVYSPDGRPCSAGIIPTEAGIVQDITRPQACILGKMLKEADEIEMFNH